MRMPPNFRSLPPPFLLACIVAVLLFGSRVQAQIPASEAVEQTQPQSPTDEVRGEKTAAEQDAGRQALSQLRNADPQQRQLAAEKLARLAPIEHLRLVQGYRLQERDARVRLALDWALYRLGKPEALFGVVGALETGRREQAIEYLARLDDATTLVALLKSPKREVKTGVLEALGRVGNRETKQAIEPLVASKDLNIAAAAQLALTQIDLRLERRASAPTLPTRPRQTGQAAKEDNRN